MGGETGSSQITQEISKSDSKDLPSTPTNSSSPVQHLPHRALNPLVPSCKCILNILAVYLLDALASPWENRLLYSEKGITIESLSLLLLKFLTKIICISTSTGKAGNCHHSIFSALECFLDAGAVSQSLNDV